MNGSKKKIVVIKDEELWLAIQKEAYGLESYLEALRKYNLPPPTNRRGPKPRSKGRKNHVPVPSELSEVKA